MACPNLGSGHRAPVLSLGAEGGQDVSTRVRIGSQRKPGIHYLLSPCMGKAQYSGESI